MKKLNNLFKLLSEDFQLPMTETNRRAISEAVSQDFNTAETKLKVATAMAQGFISRSPHPSIDTDSLVKRSFEISEKLIGKL